MEQSHIRLAEESQPGMVGSDGRGEGRRRPGGRGLGPRDPRLIRAGIIEDARDLALKALTDTRQAIDMLAVVDREAAQKKEWVAKAVVDLVEHLEDKT